MNAILHRVYKMLKRKELALEQQIIEEDIKKQDVNICSTKSCQKRQQYRKIMASIVCVIFIMLNLMVQYNHAREIEHTTRLVALKTEELAKMSVPYAEKLEISKAFEEKLKEDMNINRVSLGLLYGGSLLMLVMMLMVLEKYNYFHKDLDLPK